MHKYIASKKFYKETFKLIIPIMIQQLFVSIAMYIDNIMVNSFGQNGLAYTGLSGANRIMFIFNYFFLGLSAAASIFIAQYFGAKDKEKVHEATRMSFYAAIIFGVIGSGLLLAFGDFGIGCFVQNKVSRSYGFDYIKIIAFGLPILSLNVAFSSSFRSIKKSRYPMYIGLFGILLNIFLNWCMIFGNLNFPVLGVKGAAYATLISKFVEIIIYIIIILVDKKLFIYGVFSKLKVSTTLLVKYIKKGTPICVNELLFSFGLMLFALFYTYKNDMWFSAYSYSQNISDLFLVIIEGIGSGCAIIIGGLLGSSKYQEAKDAYRYFKALGVFMGLVVGGLMALSAPLTVKMFSLTGEIKNITIQILLVQSIFVFAYLYCSVNFFTLRAGGDTKRAFLSDQIPTYLIGIPLVAFLGLNASAFSLSLPIIFTITHICDLSKVVAGDIFIKQGAWVENLTVDKVKIAKN